MVAAAILLLAACRPGPENGSEQPVAEQRVLVDLVSAFAEAQADQASDQVEPRIDPRAGRIFIPSGRHLELEIELPAGAVLTASKVVPRPGSGPLNVRWQPDGETAMEMEVTRSERIRIPLTRKEPQRGRLTLAALGDGTRGGVLVVEPALRSR